MGEGEAPAEPPWSVNFENGGSPGGSPSQFLHTSPSKGGIIHFRRSWRRSLSGLMMTTITSNFYRGTETTEAADNKLGEDKIPEQHLPFHLLCALRDSVAISTAGFRSINSYSPAYGKPKADTTPF